MNLIQLITPTNLAQEKELLFADSKYHPQFQYNWDKQALQTWLESHPRYRAFGDALLLQDHASMTQEASKLFSVEIDNEYLRLARRIVANKPDRFKTQNSEQTAKAFKTAFEYFGLSEYRLEIVDQHGFNFRPVPLEKKISMSAQAKIDFFSIDSEVKHELAHIIRYENGKHNQIKPSQNYLPTEEGLAAYCQDYAGHDGQVSLFQHAAEYAVTPVALSGSLRNVVEYLVSIGFSEELAWQRGIRHKIGWVDTSRPGDIMKPSMYFHFQQKVRLLSDSEKFRLFVGKIRIDELDSYPEYMGIIPEDKLKEFYKWKLV